MRPRIYPIPTAERVREVFDYNPETGLLFWKVSLGDKCVVGQPTSQRPSKIGYLRVRLDGVLYYAHQLIWLHYYGVWPTPQVDHKNTVRHENWVANLRLSTHSQNMMNRRVNSNNKTGIKGVCWDLKAKKFIAQIQKDGERFRIGYFDKKEDAGTAYAAESDRLFGKFARVA